MFDGTPLEGAEVTGRLGGVIDTYGSQVISELRKNKEFYAKANTSLKVAWDERQALIDERDAQPVVPSPSASSTAPPAQPSDAVRARRRPTSRAAPTKPTC